MIDMKLLALILSMVAVIGSSGALFALIMLLRELKR